MKLDGLSLTQNLNERNFSLLYRWDQGSFSEFPFRANLYLRR